MEGHTTGRGTINVYDGAILNGGFGSYINIYAFGNNIIGR
jgi:hypothetical protein